MLYKKVNLFYEPEEEACTLMNGENRKYSEMTKEEHAFLCGLMKEKKPKKILEIGVSAGGTTASILACLKMLGYDAKLYSVDLGNRWYRSDSQETGFLVKKFRAQFNSSIRHEMLLGKSIPHVIEKIGKNIDFLILDTTHAMPGELLDFIVCLPYLQDGCVVVLHDVIENHIMCRDAEIATKLLFDVVTGEKWYGCGEKRWEREFEFSNIAAFQVNKQKRENICNVYSALSFSWSYMLADEELEKYAEIIGEGYGIEYARQFIHMAELQKYTQIRKRINDHYRMNHEFLRLKWEKQKTVFLFGGGEYARVYTEYARINHLPVSGWVISDDQKMIDVPEDSIPVYWLKDLPYSCDECSFVLALDHKYFSQVKKNLMDRGYYMIL